MVTVSNRLQALSIENFYTFTVGGNKSVLTKLGNNAAHRFIGKAEIVGDLSGDTKLKVDNSWGLALQAGFDFDLGNNWLLSSSV